jgi:hypothetical protein
LLSNARRIIFKSYLRNRVIANIEAPLTKHQAVRPHRCIRK